MCSLKSKFCICDWQINVSIFSNVIRLQLPPNRSRMQQKYELGTTLTYFWHKNESKISLNFIFVFKPLSFRHKCPRSLLSKFASQIKLIQSVVWVSCKSDGHSVPFPGSQVSGSHVPGSQVPRSQFQGHISKGPRSQSPGSQVLILD